MNIKNLMIRFKRSVKSTITGHEVVMTVNDYDYSDISIWEYMHLYVSHYILKEIESHKDQYITDNSIDENYKISANIENSRNSSMRQVFSDPWWVTNTKTDLMWHYPEDYVTYVKLVKSPDGKNYAPVFYSSSICEATNNKERKLVETIKFILANTSDELLQGQEVSVSHKESTTESFVTTHKETSRVNTGDYIIQKDYSPGSRQSDYLISPEQRTVTKTVSQTHTERVPMKIMVKGAIWITPENANEENRFNKVVENQHKMEKLCKEYSYLGLMDGAKKKEIAKELTGLLEFSRMVILKAIMDRVEEPSIASIDEEIKEHEDKISELQAESEKISKTAFGAKSTVKKSINDLKIPLTCLYKKKEECKHRLLQIQKYSNEINNYINAINK